MFNDKHSYNNLKNKKNAEMLFCIVGVYSVRESYKLKLTIYHGFILIFLMFMIFEITN